MNSNTDVRSPSQDLEELRQALVEDFLVGTAVSSSQAAHMADIMLAPCLPLEAKAVPLTIARKIGADFDPCTVTAEQIHDGIVEWLDARNQFALAIAPVAGSA